MLDRCDLKGYSMDMPLSSFIAEKGFYISFESIAFFVLLTSLCLLFTKYKLGLLLSYGFAFYWIYVKNGNCFIDILAQTTWGLPVFGLTGFIMVVFFIVSLFHDN